MEIAKQLNLPIIYGDASQPIVLEAAHIDKARLLIITVPSIIVANTVVDRARQFNPSLSIVARVSSQEHMLELHKKGVYEVVLPELEASLELTRQALIHLNIPLNKIHDFTDIVHKEHYAPLYDSESHYREITQLKSISRGLDLRWVSIPPGSPLIGKNIAQLQIRNKTGVSIVAIIQDDKFIPNPGADYVFHPLDLVGVIGSFQQIQAFKTFVLPTAHSAANDTSEN